MYMYGWVFNFFIISVLYNCDYIAPLAPGLQMTIAAPGLCFGSLSNSGLFQEHIYLILRSRDILMTISDGN